MKFIIYVALLSLVLTGCALIGGGEPDIRWADYKSWTKIHAKPITGDHTGFLGGLHQGEHGVRQVYVNDVGLDVSQGGGPYQYPVGTVVLKEQYKNQAAFDSNKSPDVTVMVKVSDDAANPASNWAWSRGYTREAKVEDSFCSSCHTIAFQTDFVFSNRKSLSEFQ